MKHNRRDFLKLWLGGMFSAILGRLGLVRAEAEEKGWHHIPLYWEEPHVITLHIDENENDYVPCAIEDLPNCVTTVICDKKGRVVDTGSQFTGDNWMQDYIEGFRLDILTDKQKREAFVEMVYASYDQGETWTVEPLQEFLGDPI